MKTVPNEHDMNNAHICTLKFGPELSEMRVPYPITIILLRFYKEPGEKSSLDSIPSQESFRGILCHKKIPLGLGLSRTSKSPKSSRVLSSTYLTSSVHVISLPS